MVIVVSLISKNNEVIVLSNTEITQIGRGFFQCEDKRVSKKHGEITVENATIRIKSCSINPIFYKVNGKDGPKEILRKDTEIVLKNSDTFSLLPDEFEFTVKVEDNENSSAFRVRQINEINENLESGDMALSLSQILRQSNFNDSEINNISEPMSIDQDNQTVTSTTISSTVISTSSRKRSLEGSQNDESSEVKKIKPCSTTTELVQPSSTSDEQEKLPNSESNDWLENQSTKVLIKPDPDSTEQSSNNQNLPSTSSKQQDSSNENIVKSEPDAVKTEPVAADNNTSSSCQSNENPQQPANNRPSCEFGIRCYRMTDDHRRVYAHPMDSDYRRPNFPPAEPGSPRCPYWDACYRRNPEHFRTMSHPSSDLYTTQRPPQMQNIFHPANNYNDQAHFSDSDISDIDNYDSFDDSDVDQDYEIDGSHSSLDDDENNLEE